MSRENWKEKFKTYKNTKEEMIPDFIDKESIEILEKVELLTKDLYARIPYGTIIKTLIYDRVKIIGINSQGIVNFTVPYSYTTDIEHIEHVKPYLFPLSSAIEEKDIEIHSLNDSIETFDWLNRNHFDYRGLIDKGLAIDATNLNIY